MAALTKQQLLQKLVSAASFSGWSVNYDGAAQHPFRLILTKDNEAEGVLVYIWNISHGGGKERPSHEYRIQITGVSSIEVTPSRKTLLLGYWGQHDVFAGWDASRHSGLVTGFSPSFQIRQEYLLKAHTDGLAVCPRGSDEVAVAFNQEAFISYVCNLYELHGVTTPQEQVVVAQIVETGGQLNEAAVSSLPVERQVVIRRIAERQRATDFRDRILAAYKNRCAFCGVQLQLVDAAHIVPVKHTESNDDTSNGLCLCALHHRAFDQGLVAVLPDYQIAINRTKLALLRSQSLSAGEDGFVKNLQMQISTPQQRSERPNVTLIRTALRVRELQHDALEPVPSVTG